VTLIGFGSAVITPPVPLQLAGFGARTAPATSVHDDLEARAVHVSDGDVAVCLIVCDLLGMSAEFADPVRDAVGAALGIGTEAVLTACTHTHAGPSAIAGAQALGWPTPEGYAETLVEGCVAAATAARDGCEEAELHFVRAPLPDGLSHNRRDLPYDPFFAVLDARRSDGSRVGVLANIAIHPVALGPGCLAVSTDWVGPFRAEVERAVGGTAVLLSGALGDVNPRGPHDHPDETGDFAEAARLGADVAAATVAVLPDAEPAGSGVRVVARRTIAAPTGTTLLTAVLGRPGPIDVELVEWQLGDVRLVSVPGEAFCAFGRAVQDVRGERVLLAGLSPIWQGYLPKPFGEGYEEGVSYGEPAVDAIFDALMQVPDGPRLA
jgi:neutral ceramidase